MLGRWTGTTRGAKRRTCLALLGVLGVFASGAYSVYAVDEPEDNPGVPAPSITAKPAKGTSRMSASFSYTDRWRRVSFQCSLDGSHFRSCASPTRYPGPLAPGGHTFRVRALGSHRGRKLSRTASYTWLIDPQPPTPYITRHPTDPTSAKTATFAFIHGEAQRATLQCRIDTHAWRACSSPVSYRRLRVGEHHFRVRALDPPAPPSPVARFDWHVVTQQSRQNFSISAGEIAGGLLYPGAAPQAIPITLANPNGVSIFVTSLTVTVPSGPAGCDSATNLSLAQSDVSSAAPVEIHAHGSVTLPAQGRSAPTIGLVNLPVNQDACQNARFPLSFTGSAHS
jgi:hypothetical protein